MLLDTNLVLRGGHRQAKTAIEYDRLPTHPREFLAKFAELGRRDHICGVEAHYGIEERRLRTTRRRRRNDVEPVVI